MPCRRSSRSPVIAAVARQPLVSGDVLRRARAARGERRLLERFRAVAGDPSRALRSTSSSARPAIVPLLRTSTTWVSPVVARQRSDELRRGLAVERAAALLEQLRLGRERWVAVQLQQFALDLGRPRPRAACRRAARRALRRGGRSSGGSTTESRPAARVATRAGRRRRRARRRARPAGRAKRRFRQPNGAHPGRWLRPTWSTSDPLGLHIQQPAASAGSRSPRCTARRARWPASSRLRVTIPTGFVKSTIQASSAARSRTRSAIPRTTGTVRSAFANPPAPVVSWPMHPHASGIVSSESRAACPPTRTGSGRTTRRRGHGRGHR